MAATTCDFDVVFVEPLADRLTCPICHLTFRETTLARCGHNFCTSCLTQCLQQSASCPVCRMPLEESSTFPNKALKREILDLKIKCCLCKKLTRNRFSRLRSINEYLVIDWGGHDHWLGLNIMQQTGTSEPFIERVATTRIWTPCFI